MKKIVCSIAAIAFLFCLMLSAGTGLVSAADTMDKKVMMEKGQMMMDNGKMMMEKGMKREGEMMCNQAKVMMDCGKMMMDTGEQMRDLLFPFPHN